MPELTERALTLRYVAALCLIAVFTLLSHLTLSRVLDADEGSARIIHLSTEQQTGVQRVASMAAQYALGEPGARLEMLQALDRLQREFRRESRDEGGPALAAYGKQRALAIFREGLAEGMRRFIARARALAAMRPGEPGFHTHLDALLRQSRESLPRHLHAVSLAHVRAADAHLRRLRLLQNGVLVVILSVLLFEALGIFRPMIRRIMAYAHRLRELATTDELTGLLNRRELFSRGARLLERGMRDGERGAVLLLDIDHFKAINDGHGHAAGDAVLRAVGHCLRGGLRPGDAAGRLGGEEFALVLGRLGPGQAVAVAERVRQSLAQMSVALPAGPIGITVSIGVAVADAGPASLEALLDVADRALYEAKAAGRNRVRQGTMRSAEKKPEAHADVV